MASTSSLCKESSTSSNSFQENCNYDLNLVNHLSTVLKFDEIGLKLCGFIDEIPLETLKFIWDIMLQKGFTVNFSFDQLYSLILKADPTLHLLIKSPKDVKDFLSKYDYLFIINSEKVSLSNVVDSYGGHLKWIKSLLQNDYPDVNRTVLNAISFYSDILFNKEDNFPIEKLVTHRNKAKQDVQIIAINPTELKSFLIAYPQVFIVKEEKVSLTYSAACNRSDYTWLGETCGMIMRTPKLRILGKAITYYVLILFKQNVHRLTLSELFAYKNFASKDIKELTTTLADLKKLFVTYNCVFHINKNDVTIKDSLLISLKRDEIRLRGQKGIDISTKEVIDIIKKNLLKPALDVCLREIKKTLFYKCTYEVPLKILLSEFENKFENINDLKNFLSCYPRDFVIKEDKVLLAISDNTSDIGGTPIISKLSSLNKNMKISYKPALVEKIKDFCVTVLLQNVGYNVQLPLAQFKQCISFAPPELQPILRNENDFKTIISKYSNILSFNDNFILLKKECNDSSINLLKNKFNESLMYFIWVLKEKVGIEIEFPIARLKMYVDLSPPEVTIKNTSELKTFLKKYPDVFIINNHNVILKNLNDENYFKYPGYEKISYIESYSTAEGIAFYARILNRFCSNLEVPFEHLFGYRSLAPVEVIALAKSPSDLKKFLSSHPDIFTVKDNNVHLTKNYEHSESSLEIYDDQEALAINFYSSILDRVSYNKEFPIARLFGYQYLASSEVRDLIKTPLELKNFLNKYPNVFFVNNDVVHLKKLICKNKDIHWNEKLSQSSNFLKDVETTLSDLNLNANPTKKPSPSINIQKKTPSIPNEGFVSRKSSIIRSIRFYSNIMFKKGPNSEHQIYNLLSFRSEATNEIKEIAKKPVELLTFLSKFPKIFTVNRSKLTVMLTDMVSFYKNERNWIIELLPKYHQSTTNHGAIVSGIQFYVNIIFERGLQDLPIKSLFKYRKTAMGDVQVLANNANELKDFLSMYPEIFIICDECVSLTPVAVSHKTEPKWIEDIIGDNYFINESSNTEANVNNEQTKKNLGCDKLSTIQNNDSVISADANTLMSLNFFKSILEKEGTGLTYIVLFEYLQFAPQEVKESFRTPTELEDFFTKHPTIFTVQNELVGVVKTKNASKVKKRKKQKSVKNLDPFIMASDTGTNTKNPESGPENNNVACHFKDSDKKNSQCDVVSTILFYSNIMWQKGPHLEHNIGNIFSHSSKAANNIRETIKNTKDLKQLLSKYPQLFSVNHEKQTVSLSDFKAYHENQRSWVKSMLPDHHHSTAKHEVVVSTILFYSNILYEKSPKCVLPLSILFSHRNGATQEVQMFIKSIKELNSFFSMFPDIFIINEDKVSLTDFVISQLRQPKWIEQIVNGHELSIKNISCEEKDKSDFANEVLLKKKTIAKRRTVQFFYKIMLSSVSNKGFPLSQLFDYLHEAPNDVQEVVKTVDELKNFFSKYPHIFTITDDIVFLTKFDN